MVAWQWRAGEPGPTRAVRFSITNEHPISMRQSEGRGIAIPPDGKRLALEAVGYQIWILDLATETPTLVSGNGFYPLWSPDGSELTFGSTRNQSLDLFRVPSDLSRPESLLLDWEHNLRSAAMSPAGVPVFREEIPGKGMDLKLWPEASEGSIIGLLEGSDDELAPPDFAGRQVGRLRVGPVFAGRDLGDELSAARRPHADFQRGRHQPRVLGGRA